jgi:two-component system, LytTR family, sensor kinase
MAISNLNKRLFLTGLVASPIIAFYGVSPFYIFNQVTKVNFTTMWIGLSLNILGGWLILQYLVSKFPKLNNVLLLLITMLGTLLVRLLLNLTIQPILPLEPPVQARFLLYPITASIAFNIIILIIIKSITNSYYQNKIQQELQALKLQNTEAQKQVLQQQLQPHFLFNALSILKSLIKQNPQDAEAYVLRLSDFLRYSAQSAQHTTATVASELQFANDFVELQKVRFQQAINYKIDIPSQLMQNHLPILSIQTLVENIFKHNQYTNKNPLEISITYKPPYISIYNSISTTKPSDSLGTGLSNLQKRYQLIAQASIVIINEPHFFEVQIPLLP